MKNIITALAIVSASVIVSSCATSGDTAAATASGVKPYPFDYCIVMNSKLGSMGDPVTRVYNGQEVKFCCAPCIKKFEKNPEKYLAKLK